jgi:hypothetical protein
MSRTALRIAMVSALSLAAAACLDSKPGGGAAAADSTQPAGTQPAPTPQTNAAPQTGPNTPPADSALPPVEHRDTAHHLQPGQTYASCLAKARAANEDERALLEQTCRQLPDAPK